MINETEKMNAGVKICNESLYQGCKIKGILFDMDGVVLDSEKLYTRFWQEGARAVGYPMTFEQALGMRSLNHKASEERVKIYFGEHTDYWAIRNKRIELMDAFIEQHGIDTKPGIYELLTYLREHGIKSSIATSTRLELAKQYLGEKNLVELFDEIVGGDMVTNGKPEPDIYLLASSKLGLKPEECLVIEDSPAGILAANRAGCIPVMVPDQDEPSLETQDLMYAIAPNLLSLKSFLQ